MLPDSAWPAIDICIKRCDMFVPDLVFTRLHHWFINVFQLARQYHPDVSDAPDAEAKFKEISQAYEVLSNPELKVSPSRPLVVGATFQNTFFAHMSHIVFPCAASPFALFKEVAWS